MSSLSRQFAVAALVGALAGCAAPETSVRLPMGISQAHWILAPSEAYDALCMINLLTGDPFYVDRYKDDFVRFDALLGPAQREALGRLRRHIKTERGNLIGPWLALVFSAADVRRLVDLQRLVDRDDSWRGLRRLYSQTRFGTAESIAAMDEVRGDLSILFRFLQRAGFSAYWRAHVLPRVRAFIARERGNLPRYDVIGFDEQVLGRKLPTDEVTVYLLGYARPHGIRVTGWRFLTDVSNPLDITVKTALHELLHPPFADQGKFASLVEVLKADAFMHRLVAEHDASFGYKSVDGLVDEDCATTVDVFNAHRLGLLDDVPRYFAEHDDGIHVLAFLLYQELAKRPAGTSYDDFVLASVRNGAIGAKGMEAAFRAAPDHYAVKALGER